MTNQIIVMGCGHSAGSPLIGNDWLNCDPNEPKNRRTRPSVALQSGECTLVIDTGPDFKEQITRCDINRIDAVLYTHYHSDHTTGMDDLRHFCRRRNLQMPVYMSDQTYHELEKRFDYLFFSLDQLYPSLFTVNKILADDFYQPTILGGIPVTLFEQDHTTCTSIGVRFGNVGYSTDMFSLNDRSIDILRGVDVWIADGAAYNNPPTVHATLDMVYALNEKIGAKQVYITHMPPTMDYQTLCRELPPGFSPAYDGLIIPVTI